VWFRLHCGAKGGIDPGVMSLVGSAIHEYPWGTIWGHEPSAKNEARYSPKADWALPAGAAFPYFN